MARDPAVQGAPAIRLHSWLTHYETGSKIPDDFALPTPNDDPSTLITKLAMVAPIASDNRNLAPAKNHQETSTLERDTGGAASAQTRSIKCESWEAYPRGSIQLPNID